MKLVRNTDPQGRGKYALVNMEKLRRDWPQPSDDLGFNPPMDALEALAEAVKAGEAEARRLEEAQRINPEDLLRPMTI